MKGIKKLIISLLALVMVMGASMTAFAAGNGSITISNAKKKQVYNAYRVFDYYAADEGTNGANMANGGIYKLSNKFSGFKYDSVFSVRDGGILAFTDTFTAVDENGQPTSDAQALVAEFGQAVLAYAASNGITPDGSNTQGDSDATDSAPLTITGLDYGYYVVDSSLGSAVAVNTTVPNAVIEEKNDVPDLDKTIQEQQGENVVDLTGNDAQIGDVVNFAVTAQLKKGGENYEIVDKTTEGLDIIDDSFDISFETVEVAHDAVSVNTDKHGFSLKFTAVPSEDTVCTVTYQAKVNVSAKISPETNNNEAYLKYGHELETTHKITTTKTYPIQIKKVAKDDTTEKVLPGAKFKVYRALDKSQVKFTKISGTEYKVDPDGTEEEIVTVAETPVTVEGLNAENYVLVETQAPQGYNLLETKVTVGETEYEHAQQVTVLTTYTGSAVQVEKVEDGTGLTLPSTGGIGTTIFYIVGGILIVAGAAYFIVRRKAAAK